MSKLTLKDVLKMKMKLQGGPGSGNFGHAGRPGKVGGSQKDDFGDYNREGFHYGFRAEENEWGEKLEVSEDMKKRGWKVSHNPYYSDTAVLSKNGRIAMVSRDPHTTTTQRRYLVTLGKEGENLNKGRYLFPGQGEKYNISISRAIDISEEYIESGKIPEYFANK
jgi:hypothetical protein